MLADALRFVRFSHTIFALPFALGSMLVAAGGLPGWKICGLIVLAMVFARTAAMVFNRLADWEIDRRNPRTAARHRLLAKPAAVTLLVVDDGGYGMLRFDQQVFGHPERGVDLLTPEWHSLGAAFGIAAENVDDVTGIGPALQRAHEANLRGEPRILVWKQRLFPPRTTSPRWFE